MRVISYQRMGCMVGKKEMEDRAVAGKNILAFGYHAIEDVDDGVYGVFDGVGGLQGSSFASTLAARALADIKLPTEVTGLRDTLYRVHEDLVNYSKTATTATGLCVSQSNYYLFHIGNTRLYGLFDGYIRPLTTDQTEYEALLRNGVLPLEISESAKCELKACLGVDMSLFEKITIREVTSEIAQCSRLLLTSDGIHDFISIDDLELALNGELSEASLKSLANQAVEKGSEDDLTIMVLEK